MAEPTKIEKRGFRVPVDLSETLALMHSGFPQKGHWEEVPLTDEDRAAHARAVAAVKEVESNRWVRLVGYYDYELDVRPLQPERRFVPEETSDEHMARWVAAGRPVRDFLGDALRARISHLYASTTLPPGSSFAAAHTLEAPHD